MLKLVRGGDRLPPAKRPKIAGEDEVEMTKEEEEEFLKLLEDELEKFNGFFVEKEEDNIIRQKELHDRAARAEEKGSIDELMKVRKEIVDFHGEMVLLENYSTLNYTGLVKILKKYDKRTGALIRLPFIQKVLQQPFLTTDLLNRLVKECESMLDHLSPKSKASISAKDDVSENPTKAPESSLIKGEIPDLEVIKYMESLYMKSTISALKVPKEIRSGSSTVSVFSLPPLQTNGEERVWDKVSAIEQLAK